MRFNPIKLRKTILKMAYSGSTVHIACAFSIVEILSVLYRNYLHYPDNNPNNHMRDYFVLSKGHGIMAQYACMLERGWLSNNDIINYFSNGSNLYGLSDSRVPGVEVTSGSLGHGLSIGVGLAIGAKLRNTCQKTYTLVGDGEINEGQVWEGLLCAAHHKLNNFMVIVDENGFQAMGKTPDIINLDPINDKFKSFGFDVKIVDGHDEKCIDEAVSSLWCLHNDKPKALIAKTIKGKGVSFMENNNSWHYSRLNEQSYKQAILSLNESR